LIFNLNLTSSKVIGSLVVIVHLNNKAVVVAGAIV
jgi:hypothetical protein